MKRVIEWGKVLAVVLLAIIVGETFKPLKDLEFFIKQYEFLLLVVVGGMTVIGFVLLMGSVLDLIMTQGEPISHEEVEDLSRRSRDLAARPYTWRASTYRTGARPAAGKRTTSSRSEP